MIKSLSFSFKNKVIVAFESRMALPMQRLIEKHSGIPLVAPSMREVPLENNTEAFAFYERLQKGKIDLFIILTGIALRTFLTIIESKFPKEEIINTLSTKTKILVRGPKPTAVCKMNNISIAYTAPEPNTWREILELLAEQQSLAQKNVAVLEYGVPNQDFLDALVTTGAVTHRVPVYKWDLPEDLAPLHHAIDEIVAGKVHVALFTSAAQADHLLKIARDKKVEAELRRQFHRIVTVSIGPVMSERLREHQLFPDLEVFPNKMDNLVATAAKKSASIWRKKKERADRAWCRVNGEEALDALRVQQAAPLHDSSFLRACKLLPSKTIPIWLMRQAGRYMAEYQMVRNNVDFLTLCKTPQLAAEATITALERLGVDAAIIFSDILVVCEAMGQKLEYLEKSGPHLSPVVRTSEDIAKLGSTGCADSLGYVYEAISLVRKSIDSRIPLIGFAGAPFTMASYMIEGSGSKNFIATKTLMHSDVKSWNMLMNKLVLVITQYLNAQIKAGAQALQLFDSWAGSLTPSDYANYALPALKKVIGGIKKGTPILLFGSYTEGMLPMLKSGCGDVISIDWKADIKAASKILGPKLALQGNLDPVLLFSKPKFFLPEVKKILQAVGRRKGFIFNLGHGILPETPADHVMALVDYVHGFNS